MYCYSYPYYIFVTYTAASTASWAPTKYIPKISHHRNSSGYHITLSIPMQISYINPIAM